MQTTKGVCAIPPNPEGIGFPSAFSMKRVGDKIDWLKHLTEQVKKCVADIERATGEIEKVDGGGK